MQEMNRQKLTTNRDDVLMDVIRNMETKLDDVKWPAKVQSKMSDIEEMLAEQDPDVARRIELRNR